MLSVSAAFAVDDSTDVIAIDNEVTVDESLAVVENDIVSANESTAASDNVVTKDTFNNYFDSNGTLRSDVNATELTFSGDISDVGVNTIVLDRSIKVIGENSTLTDIAVDVKASDVVISGLTINQNNGTAAILIENASNVQIEDTIINFNAIANSNGYAINADLADNLKLLNNVITYVGATTGWEVNNGIRVSNSNGAVIGGNKFNLTLVSAAVGWAEVPSGSGNWVSSPITEGIVIDSSNDVEFANNTVDVTYNNVVGSYDTIYSIRVTGSSLVAINNNNITSLGHTYIYGIQMGAKDFIINGNNIISESDNYYANGIDVEGPANGVISENTISAKGSNLAYPIYSGMNSQNVSTVITNNTISGEAYLVLGLSLGDVESSVLYNDISIKGNYTTGIASVVENITVVGNNIALTSSEEGNESVWEAFGVESAGVKIVKGEALIKNNTISAQGKGITATGGNVVVSSNTVDLTATSDKDAYGIYALNVPGIEISENTVNYVGSTNGTGINNGVLISNSTGAAVKGNKFNLSLVSAFVPWIEEPAGSWNYVAHPKSEGIVVSDSSDVKFEDNDVDVTANAVSGSYDTIYSINFKNSDNAVISNNDIDAEGYYYIYAIQMNGNNFTISENNISAKSDVYYANGIDIEGSASGIVKDNEISAEGANLAYPIYSGMNGKDVYANYTGNKISGEAYFVLGMSLGDKESTITDNEISLKGNYTTGIAFAGSALVADSNKITLDATNVGNESIWESFGVDTIGVKVKSGVATVTNNKIVSTANNTVDVKDTNSSVHDNYLLSNETYGDLSVINTNAEVYNNTPITTKAIITITEVDGDSNITGILTDSEGNTYADEVINYSFNGVNATVKTDENGVFIITNLTNGKVDLSYDGTIFMAPANASITLKDIAPQRVATKFNVTEGQIIKTYAVDYPAGEKGTTFKFQLTDSEGNPIVNASVQFAYKTSILNRTTNEEGIVSLGVSTQFADSYLCALSYLGDETHDAAFVAFNFKLNKKPITITAKAKTFKKSTKTKKYTVTLKTKKCASKDGKIYLKSGKKVTLKVNGKTFSAKINSKGKVTFKITNLKKKGKFVALIKFAGDKTYNSASKKVTITVK